MRDIELIIRIPEHAYEECKKVKLTEALEGVPFHVMKAIANGTPIQKGRGDLKEMETTRAEELSHKIVEMFDEMLYNKQIIVPNEEREEDSGTSLYGLDYWNLVDKISILLQSEVSKWK